MMMPKQFSKPRQALDPLAPADETGAPFDLTPYPEATSEPPKAEWTPQQELTRAVAQLVADVSALTEAISHTHGDPAERTYLQQTIASAGVVARRALQSKIIWGGYHIDLGAARTKMEAVIQTVERIRALIHDQGVSQIGNVTGE